MAEEFDPDSLERRRAFFYAEAEAGLYDATIESVVPQYRELHDCLLKLVEIHMRSSPELTERTVVLDVGSGTGTEALAILKRFESVRLLAVDLCAPMNQVLREKLAESKLEHRCAILHSDFLARECEPARLLRTVREALHDSSLEVSLVISAFALHHLDSAGKLAAYQRVHDCLAPEGLFLCADLFSYGAQELASAAFDFDLEWIRRSFADRSEGSSTCRIEPERCLDLAARWLQHYREDNRLLPLTSQAIPGSEMELLRAAGFREAEVPYRFWQSGIFWARKRSH